MKYLFLLLFLFFFISCAETTQKMGPINGTLDGKCFTNNTCNDGLICQNNKCVTDKCFKKECDNWLECSQATGKCDKVKDGYCTQNADCNIDANEVCDENHQCNVKNTEVKDCSTNDDCKNNTINTSCNNGICVNPTNDLCINTDCSADANAECNPNTGNCDCKNDFHKENNECISNTKEVNCKKTEIANSEYTINTVTIHYTEDGWDSIPECEWTCKNNYYKKANTCEACNCLDWQTCQEDGTCNLTSGRCKNSSDCPQNKECISHNCVNANNPCEDIDCGGLDDEGVAKGVCNNVNGTAICVCQEGYFDDGSLNCINPCEGKTCSSHGSCIATTILNAHCKCDPNYFEDGFNCVSPCTGHWDCNIDTSVNPNDDQTKTITIPHGTIKRGTCTATDINTATCNCIDGYEDNDNNLICTSVCTGITCGGHGTCAVLNGEANCNCNNGYAKTTNNSLECLDIDECTNNLDNCDTHATCTNNSGSFTCACNSGYTGNGVSCTPLDACNNSCNNWEYCDSGICKAVTGRCNRDIDCSRNDCLIRKNANSSPIDPVINPDCQCDYQTHYCYDPNANNP